MGDRFYLYGSRIVCENHGAENTRTNSSDHTAPLIGYHDNNNNNYDYQKHHHTNLNGQQNSLESSHNSQQSHSSIVDAVN